MDIRGDEASIDAWGDRIEAALCDSDFDAARADADHARTLAVTPRDRARAALWRARCDYMTGNHEAALRLALEAVESGRALVDVELEASGQTLLARILWYAGDSEAALAHALAAVRLIEAAGPASAAALLRSRMMSEAALGVAYLSLNNLTSALDFCQRAVDSARELDDQIGIAAGLANVACVKSAIAEVEGVEGRAAESAHWLREAIQSSAEGMRMARAEGHRINEATALSNLAQLMTRAGEATQALALLDEWSQRNRDVLPHHLAHYQDTRGSVCLTLGRPEEARGWFEQALRDANSPAFRLPTLENLSKALEQCGDWQAALAYYKRFHELHVRLSAEKAQRSARISAVLLDTELSAPIQI